MPQASQTFLSAGRGPGCFHRIAPQPRGGWTASVPAPRCSHIPQSRLRWRRISQITASGWRCAQHHPPYLVDNKGRLRRSEEVLSARAQEKDNRASVTSFRLCPFPCGVFVLCPHLNCALVRLFSDYLVCAYPLSPARTPLAGTVPTQQRCQMPSTRVHLSSPSTGPPQYIGPHSALKPASQ